MALLGHDGARFHTAELTYRQVVGQGARGHEDGRLLAQQLSKTLFQPCHRPTAGKTVRHNTHFALKGFELANEPPGSLRFAIASKNYGDLRICRLWLEVRSYVPSSTGVVRGGHRGGLSHN